MTVIDDYLKHLSPTQKAAMERVRKIVLQLVPDAEEVMSYGMPAFKHKKRILIYLGAFKDHMSIFPASDDMIKAVGPKLAAFRTSKGTLQFTTEKPLPEALLKDIITFRLGAIG